MKINSKNIQAHLEGAVARFFAVAEFECFDEARIEAAYEDLLSDLYDAKLHLLSLTDAPLLAGAEEGLVVQDISDLIPAEGQDVFDVIGDYESLDAY